MAKVALITGVTGQDGAYLAELLLQKDYVLQSIDSGKHQNAKAVIARVRPAAAGGIPWMVIQGADGRPLVTSDGPKGNIGCPWEPHEIAWFRDDSVIHVTVSPNADVRPAPARFP